MHVGARHHQAGVHQRRAEKPVDPGAPILVEREGQRREREPHDHDHLEQALVAAIAGPGGNCLEHVDHVVAAANREDLDHGSLVPEWAIGFVNG